MIDLIHIDSLQKQIAVEQEKTKPCDSNRALGFARILLGQMHFHPHDPEVFVATLEKLFSSYPVGVVEFVCDPVLGYAANHSRADLSLIKKLCDHRRSIETKKLHSLRRDLEDMREEHVPSEAERREIESGFKMLKQLLAKHEVEKVEKNWCAPRPPEGDAIRATMGWERPSNDEDE